MRKTYSNFSFKWLIPLLKINGLSLLSRAVILLDVCTNTRDVTSTLKKSAVNSSSRVVGEADNAAPWIELRLKNITIGMVKIFAC
jgi:hypothetical protein